MRNPAKTCRPVVILLIFLNLLLLKTSYVRKLALGKPLAYTCLDKAPANLRNSMDLDLLHFAISERLVTGKLVSQLCCLTLIRCALSTSNHRINA